MGCFNPLPLSLASMLSLHKWNSRARVFAAHAEAYETWGGGGHLSLSSLSFALSSLFTSLSLIIVIHPHRLSSLLSFTVVICVDPLSFVSSTCNHIIMLTSVRFKVVSVSEGDRDGRKQAMTNIIAHFHNAPHGPPTSWVPPSWSSLSKSSIK